MKGLAATLLVMLVSLLPTGWGKRVKAYYQNDSESLAVTWTPLALVNGSPCLFRVRSQRLLRSLRGRWQERTIFFNFDASSGTWYGFAGLGLEAVPGEHRLQLQATTTNGARIFVDQSVPVGRADYQTIALSVPRTFTEPNARARARISREQALKQRIFRRITPSRLWRESFAPPIDSVVTDDFGVQRTFNGKVQSTHQGLDLEAEMDTPVSAMNSGLVVLAREMFYEGGFVVIDHGQGLLTLYLHLSEIKVREGERVAKKQVIGLSGDTGRVTGPHLHIGIRWQGIYVNPETLMNLQLP